MKPCGCGGLASDRPPGQPVPAEVHWSSFRRTGDYNPKSALTFFLDPIPKAETVRLKESRHERPRKVQMHMAVLDLRQSLSKLFDVQAQRARHTSLCEAGP